MARGKLQGFVEQGGHTVLTDGRVSTDKVQQSFPLATVEVFNAGTAVQATIFSDEAGTPKANPFIADSTGFWFFWADAGRYDVEFSGAGIPSPFTIFSIETIIAQGTALLDPGSNGFVVRTALNTTVARTIQGTTSAIVVTNGNGVSSDPIIDLDVNINLSGKTLTGGTFVAPSIGNFSNAIHTHENAMGGGQLNATNIFSAGVVPIVNLPAMVGATGVSNGAAGLVPQPLIGDESRFLRGDGTWQTAGGGGGSPGGANTTIQYNNVGVFGGVSGATSDGTNITFGLANLRATRPRFITSIDDTNGNEVIGLVSVASAVNEVSVANAGTGVGPTVSITGGDANIDLNLAAKGTGIISSVSNFRISNNAPQITLVDVNDSKTVRISLSGANWSFINDTLGTTPLNIDTTNNLVTVNGDLLISDALPVLTLTSTALTKTWIMTINGAGQLVIGESGISNAIIIDDVTGECTFEEIPVGPASNPTTDNQLVRRKFVTDARIYFSLSFKIDDPSSFPLNDDSALNLIRIPVITNGFLTKITIIRPTDGAGGGGSHTGGTSVTFAARIFNSSTIGSGVSFSDTNNLGATEYTEDFTDTAVVVGNYITVRITARTGTVAERNVSINIEGYRTLTPQ